jgi:hypothetical protein
MPKPRLSPEEFAAQLQRTLQRKRDAVRRKRAAEPEYFRQKAREFSARNPGYFTTYSRAYADAHPGLGAARRAQKLNRLPPWADLDAIDDVYRLAREFRDAGLDVEVDHIYALQGWNVCGLHVVENLRVCLKRANQSKGIRHPVDTPGPECPFHFVGNDYAAV